ncbi:MAG TPA: O-antigen ligase family protein [Xanthobacteraceae bacterium]
MAQSQTIPQRLGISAKRIPLSELADWCALGVVASLPWSTSATGILIVLWLVCLLPTLHFAAIRREVLTAAGGLPVLLWLLAAAGMAWAEVAWADRLDGLGGFHKLLVIPLVLAHFRRSERSAWMLTAFIVSCTPLLAASYVLLEWPQLAWRGYQSFRGVLVKDYTAQGGEFVLCVFFLLPIAWRMRHARPWAALGLLLLAALFAADFLYVIPGRTALAVSAVLIIVLAFWQLGWKQGVAFVLAASAIALVVWQSSPFLRSQVSLVPQEIRQYESENVRTRSGERLEFWKRSATFIAQAPIFGHGTGTIRELFRRSAVGETGASATISPNPHNQTLAVAIQLGALGMVALYAMWIGHLLLFRGPTLADWIGLVVVLENIISSLFNSHLFDFTQGWMYVFGVGIAGGAVLRQRASTKA